MLITPDTSSQYNFIEVRMIAKKTNTFFTAVRMLMIAALALAITNSPSRSQMSKVVALVKGEVRSSSGSSVPDVQIQVYKGSEKVNSTKTTNEGKFQMVINPGADYKLICSNPKYYFTEQALSIPALEKYKEIPVTVTMRPLELGTPFPFSQPVFEPQSSTVSANVTADLDNIAAQLKRNSKLVLNVTVYPDMTPSGKNANAQNDLATARKNAIAGYFLSKGLSASNVNVTISTNVGPGKFDRTVSVDDMAAVSSKSKKKKKPSKKPTTQNIKFPQTTDVVMQVS